MSGSVPANQTVIFSNAASLTGPSGLWSWIPAPAIPTAGAPATCNTNYSPDLLVSSNGTALLYTPAAAAGPYNCEEITASAPIAP